MAVYFQDNATIQKLCYQSFNIQTLRYFCGYVHFHRQDAGIHGAQIVNICDEPNMGPEQTHVMDLWYQTVAPEGYDFRLWGIVPGTVAGTEQHRVNNALPATGTDLDVRFVFSWDTSALSNLPKTWYNGSSQTPATQVDNNTIDQAWNRTFMTGPKSSRWIVIGCENSTGSTCFDYTFYSMAFWTSSVPVTSELQDRLINYQINPVDIPNSFCFFANDWKDGVYTPDYSNGLIGRQNSASTQDLPISANSGSFVYPMPARNNYNLIPGIRSEDVTPPHIVRVR